MGEVKQSRFDEPELKRAVAAIESTKFSRFQVAVATGRLFGLTLYQARSAAELGMDPREYKWLIGRNAVEDAPPSISNCRCVIHR